MGGTAQQVTIDPSTIMPLGPASSSRAGGVVPASSSPASAVQDYSQVRIDPNTVSPISGNHSSAESTEQPGVGARVWNAGKQELGNLVGVAASAGKAVVAPPEDVSEHIASSFGPGGLVAYRTSKAVVDAMENMVKSRKESFAQAKVDMIHAINEFHKKDYRNALADTGSFVADFGGVTGDPLAAMGRERELAQGTKAGGDLATPLTKDVVDLGAAAALEHVGGKLTKGAEAGEGTEAAVATPKQPGVMKQIMSGEKVAQPGAQEALRAGAKAGGAEGGVSTVQPASLRTVLEEPINAIGARAKSLYKSIDEATGGRFQGTADKIEAVNEKLRTVTNDTEEAKLSADKDRLMWQQEKMFDEAAEKGVSKDTVSQAKAVYQHTQALKDLDAKVFKNPNIVRGNAAMGAEETINVDSAVKTLQKLSDSTKFGGSRLEQALGTEGAQALLRDMYAAQKQGITALTRRQWVGRIAKIAGLGGVGYEVLRGLFGGSR